MPRNSAKDQFRRESEWDYTEIIDRKYGQQLTMMYEEGESGSFWDGREVKTYQGRPRIERDTPINRGVYITWSRGEALVVDDVKYPEELNRVYQSLILTRQLDMQKGRAFKDGIFEDVLAISQKYLPYDLARTEAFSAEFKARNEKITLDSYIREGYGVCRHQALLAAYLLERLKKEGYVNGTPSVDRNIVKGIGGHAWVRYTSSAGEVFIIDPAQNYVGRLKDISQDRWFYERPSDKLRLPYSGVRPPNPSLISKIKNMFKQPELQQAV